ncbi:MAG TPA: cytochrome c peroxidase [Caulobacteraceae bacterium]|nr:cytochrome c peroxidase [Caulobacteraceae bacterium]
MVPSFRLNWLLALLCLCAASPAYTSPPAPQRPTASEPITPIPPATALDPRRVALGEQLFNDPRLSGDTTRTCVACHDTRTNGASAAAHDPTPDGRPNRLNTPTVFNTALNFRQNWEGDLRTLEAQAEQALRSPDTMATTPDQVLARLRADPAIVREFRQAYGRGPDRADLLDAIATYERSLLTPGGRFDRWLGGDRAAISGQEYAGYQLFKSLGCISCHQGVNVGGNLYQRHGIFHPLAAPRPEILRVPSLRNVALTPPYFHDGSAATLADAVKAMGYAQLDLVLTRRQTADIVAFLETLTGRYRGRLLAEATAATGGSTPVRRALR